MSHIPYFDTIAQSRAASIKHAAECAAQRDRTFLKQTERAHKRTIAAFYLITAIAIIACALLILYAI